MNTDASGRGDESAFRANLRRHAGGTDGLEVFACSSLQLTPKMIFERCGRARFVSIDGGHTETCTLNDLRLAEEVLADDGLVLIDDYFNPGPACRPALPSTCWAEAD
ncbi:MAG TPA: class I SAM-dependent methyltransferase [Acidimicrobiales bacterium]|nr:class I SAM-dependent methyltransferase [Acidimicrobiales bacterium]